MNSQTLNATTKKSDYLSALLDEKKRYFLLALITLAGFAMRFYAFTRFMDRPGDGPTKAMYAYNWAQNPHLLWHGAWLPGFEYLTGIFSFIVKDPLISIRVLNLAVGVCTLPVFYLLVRRIYGHMPGLVSTVLLAFLPVHVSMSVTSHTEATFIFEILAGLLLFILSIDGGPYRKLCMVAAFFFICLATMTRYEAWLLIPFFPLYYFLKTRNFLKSALVLIVLSILPLAWCIGDYIYFNNFFFGFAAAEDPVSSKAVGIIHATKIFGRITAQQIEWTLVIMAGWGFVIQLIQFARREENIAEKLLLVGITLFYWCVMFKFAMVRGESFQTRYLLFPILMILPFVMIPLSAYLVNYSKQFWMFTAFILIAFALPKFAGYYPVNDLTSDRPVEIKQLADWLQHSSYNHQPVLMTLIQGQSTYLPLYYPGIGPHDVGHFIYYPHVGMSDQRLRKYLDNQHPSLLITCKRDQDLVLHIERILGKPFNLSHPIHTQGRIDVYDIGNVFRK